LISPVLFPGPLSYGRAIDHEMAGSINPKYPGHYVVIERGKGADTTANRLRGQVKVLADVARIEMQIAVPALPVPPGHPVADRGPEKGNTATHNKVLVHESVGNFYMEI
jgi:hypothetical protein